MSTSTIRWEQDADRIVTLILDDPNQSANTMNEAYKNSMAETVARLEKEKDNIAGVIITSAKKTFFAGGDLDTLIQVTPEHAQAFAAGLEEIKQPLRKLETLGKPVVACINGAALGGGLEIALACHYRIALNNPKSEIGLPEVMLGLLPGGGGVTRTVRMLGIQNALMNVLLQGQRMKPAKAQSVGLVNELAETPEEMLEKARAWIKANPKAVQPWDVKGYKIPGGTPTTPALAMNLPAFPANLRKQTKGANYPAPLRIMAAAVEGAQVDFDNALKIEGRYFVELATGQISKNMTTAFFFNLQAINKGASRPSYDKHPKYTAKKVAVLGAGMMGAGVAYVAAVSGAEVVLKDVSLEAAEKGKAYSATILDKKVSKGRMTKEKRDEILARIHPTDKAADLAGVDFIVEAVFENPDLKKKVFQEVQDIVNPDCVLGSNTSTLPITGLAEGVKDDKRFIGIHFFSPVDKMPLVEIIRGKNTSDETLAKVFDFTLQIKKTPIVVHDSRGFFTSRVIGTFLNEATMMLDEGIPANTIEQAGLQAGYPAAPLKLVDEINMKLAVHIAEETEKALKAEGKALPEHKGIDVQKRMVEEFNRPGRRDGAGFYDYPKDGKPHLWEGLDKAFNTRHDLFDAITDGSRFEDLKERMMFIEAIETVKCFDEGVLTSFADANIGSIFGIGFPAWTGGVMQYINQYKGGLKGFVARAAELEKAYGKRFAVPQSLKDKAAKGEIYK